MSSRFFAHLTQLTALAAFTLLVFWWSLQYDPPWIQNFFETQKPALPFVKVQSELLLSKRLLLANLWNYFLPILILVTVVNAFVN